MSECPQICAVITVEEEQGKKYSLSAERIYTLPIFLPWASVLTATLQLFLILILAMLKAKILPDYSRVKSALSFC